MKILVTGGAGFIGSHVVDAYIEDGHDVVIIDDLSTGKTENINKKARFYRCDICSPEVYEIFEKEHPEILNHHAAQIDVRRSINDPLFDLKVNVGGLINLLEAGRKSGLKKTIFASSGGTVYGEQEEFPAKEDHPMRPISPYGLNKLACEQYLYFYEKVYGIRWAALRYANVYGPRQNPHGEAGVIAIFINKMLSGEAPLINGDGKQTRDYIFVKDVVKANTAVLAARMSGPYNVGTGIETDVNTIFHVIRELLSAKCEEKHGPAKSGEQLRSSILPHRLSVEFGGFTTTEFKDGLIETVRWFEKNRRDSFAYASSVRCES